MGYGLVGISIALIGQFEGPFSTVHPGIASFTASVVVSLGVAGGALLAGLFGAVLIRYRVTLGDISAVAR